MNQPQQQIQIKIDDATLKGAYANMMGVAHTKEEFVLDFINIYPAQGTGVATARVIVSPGHMKRILAAMKENIEKYEKSFGSIKESDAPSVGGIGFQA